MNRRPKRRSVPLRIAGALTAAAVAFAAPPAGANAPAPQDAAFEQAFLRGTVDHHFMGVKMGEACVRRATIDALRDLCSTTMMAQANQIAHMRMMMLRDWYGTDERPTLTSRGRANLREMRELRGARFNRVISREFIAHHLLQIRRSRNCVRTADHADLRNLCRRQINEQVHEIRDFRKFD